MEKVVKNNFFHDLGLQNGLSRGKIVFDNFFHQFLIPKTSSTIRWNKLSKPTFSTTQAVLEAQIVEKVVFDNFFHHFYDSKDFLNNSWKKWKNCQKQLFPRYGPPKRLESWKKLVLTIFPLFPRIVEEVFGIIKTVEKVVKNNFFHDSSRFGGRNRGKSWF